MSFRNNDVDFVKVVFERLLPTARVRVLYDFSVSLQATIEVWNPGYPVGNFDLNLFLDRYERNSLTEADAMTLNDLLVTKVMPVAPPVSTTPAKPDADPFAKPVGLPTPDRFKE